MLQQTISEIFERDLNKLKEEISLYKSESDMWLLKEGISNSGGNLCLHLIGNLQHFIGALLGNTGYVRNRQAEFESKNIGRKKILADLDATILVVKNTLLNLPDAELNNMFPQELGGKKFTVGQFIVHLTTHLNYHLGQINYHRRLLGAK